MPYNQILETYINFKLKRPGKVSTIWIDELKQYETMAFDSNGDEIKCSRTSSIYLAISSHVSMIKLMSGTLRGNNG